MFMESVLDSIANAIVELPEGGQGVLVTGGFVLTASHCIRDQEDKTKPLRCNDALLQETYPIEIKCKSADRYKVTPVFVDAISDVAALGPLEHPDLFDEKKEFAELVEKMSESRSLARLSRRSLALFETCKAWIHTHDHGWVDAEVEAGGNYLMNFTTSSQISGGTSGGPIVDEDGKVLGVISYSNEGPDVCDGSFASIWQCLPSWLTAEVIAAEEDEGESLA